MNKLLVAFLLLFVMGTALIGIYTEQNALSGTYTTSRMGITDSVVNVYSTAGFPATGKIEVDNEVMYYAAATPTQFRGIVRAQDNSIATMHPANDGVYTRSSGAMNRGLLFKNLEVDTSGGPVSIIMFPISLFKNVIWEAVKFDMSCFSGSLGDTPIGFISYLAAALTLPFLFTITYLVLIAIGGILQKFLNLPI